MSDYNDTRLKFNTEVVAEDSAKYPDIRLHLAVRQAMLNETRHPKYGSTVDRAIGVLRSELEYWEEQVMKAVERHHD
jgi:hypothetical protein